jgi:tetratricopeptide (TPR) repeat protein
MNRLLWTAALISILPFAAGCGGEQNGKGESGETVVASRDIVVDYPLDGSVFPPDLVPPTFLWHDEHPDVTRWKVTASFHDGEPDLTLEVPGDPPPKGRIDHDAIRDTNEIYEGTEYQRSAKSWTPSSETWDEIKRRSHENESTITFAGVGDEGEITRGSVRLMTSKDPVGAPIFYRDVPLMPGTGAKGKIQPLAPDAISLINWRLRDLAKPESHVVLKNMPSCANCHSFSLDGKTMGMDVDGPQGDKGAYMIAPVDDEMVITDERVITWNAFAGKPEGHRTIGFLSRISPHGKYVVTTLNEELYVNNFLNYKFLQVFYPTRGILGWYSRETGEIKELPGANDPEYVHCSPVWTPDGKHLVFSRARARDPYPEGRPLPKHAGDPNELPIQYDLCIMPFNDGNGGEPVPIEGASQNGMSNTFPKVSPDGKWLVWTKCKNGLLMRPDGKLWIVPLKGGEAREMRCNTSLMNSWHSFSPNGRWMVFSSKVNTPYTQMFLTHIDENGNSTPPVLVPNSTAANRAVNLPEFLNAEPAAIKHIDVPAVAHHALFREAMRRMEEQLYPDAVKLCRKALESEPDFSRARVILGWALYKTGKPEEAIRELETALRYSPHEARAHYHLGLIYEELGKKDLALEYLKNAVKYNPFDIDSQKSLGLAWFRRGELDKAYSCYLAALEVGALDPSIHESLAAVQLKRGDLAGALDRLRRVCELDPNDAETRVFLAWRLATNRDEKIRDGKGAIEYAKEACELTNWTHAGALDALAAAYAECGRWPDAVETARKAVAAGKKLGPQAEAALGRRLEMYEREQAFREN